MDEGEQLKSGIYLDFLSFPSSSFHSRIPSRNPTFHLKLPDALGRWENQAVFVDVSLLVNTFSWFHWGTVPRKIMEEQEVLIVQTP